MIDKLWTNNILKNHLISLDFKKMLLAEFIVDREDAIKTLSDELEWLNTKWKEFTLDVQDGGV